MTVNFCITSRNLLELIIVMLSWVLNIFSEKEKNNKLEELFTFSYPYMVEKILFLGQIFEEFDGFTRFEGPWIQKSHF